MNTEEILERSAQLSELRRIQEGLAAAGRPASDWVDATILRMERGLEDVRGRQGAEEAAGYVDAPWWLWLCLTLAAVAYFGYQAAGWVCK